MIGYRNPMLGSRGPMRLFPGRRKRVVERPGVKFAPAKPLQRPGHIGIERQCRFEFGSGIFPVALQAQESAVDVVRPGALGGAAKAPSINPSARARPATLDLGSNVIPPLTNAPAR
jgi:hypothetical protein